MATRKYDFHKIINRLFLFIGLGLVAHLCFLLYTTDRHTFAALNKLSPIYLLLISFCAVGPWIGHSLRIYIWSKFVHYPLPLKDCLSVVISNDVGSALTPTAVGGGPIKLGMLISKGMPSAKATFLVLLSATEDLVFYTTGIVLSFIFMRNNVDEMAKAMIGFKWPIIIIVLSILGFILLYRFNIINKKSLSTFLPLKLVAKLSSWNTKIVHYLSDIQSTYVKVIKEGKLYLLVSIILLFFQSFSKYFILAVILLAFGIDFSLFDVIVIQWIISMGMLIVPTPGASGGAEAAFLLLFKNSLPPEYTNLIVSVWRFFTYYYTLFLAVILFQLLNGKSNNELVINEANNELS